MPDLSDSLLRRKREGAIPLLLRWAAERDERKHGAVTRNPVRLCVHHKEAQKERWSLLSTTEEGKEAEGQAKGKVTTVESSRVLRSVKEESRRREWKKARGPQEIAQGGAWRGWRLWGGPFCQQDQQTAWHHGHQWAQGPKGEQAADEHPEEAGTLSGPDQAWLEHVWAGS